jgi:gliding motility-associated-like protein
MVNDTAKVNFKVLHNDQIYVKITAPNGCNNYDTASITAHQLPKSYLPMQTSVCSKDTLYIVAGTPNDSVYWYNSGNTLLSKDRSLAFKVNTSENLHLTIIDSLKCVNFDTINVHKWALPIADAGRDTLICPGGHAQLGGSNTNPNGFTFQWSPANLLNNNQVLNPIATPVNTTSFIMKITDVNSCSNYDTVIVHINPQSVINTGGDKFICIGKSIGLGSNPTASGSSLPYSYDWSPANTLDKGSIANPTATPGATTQYRLIVSTAGCIIDTSYVNITVWPLPVITKSDDVVIGYHENTTISASGGTSYRWEPENGLNDSRIASPVAAPLITTAYHVFVTDNNGCESNAQITVTVRNEIFVPNLFTPNGDGNNDYFKIYGTGIDKIHLSIFNIEGILVFETTSVAEATVTGWDGKYKGNQLPSGKYLWVLKATATDGTVLLFNGSNKGIITLLK